MVSAFFIRVYLGILLESREQSVTIILSICLTKVSTAGGETGRKNRKAIAEASVSDFLPDYISGGISDQDCVRETV